MVSRESRPSAASVTSTAQRQIKSFVLCTWYLSLHKVLSTKHKEQSTMKFPFRNLYLKIFIWFWLAMIIINVVLFAAFALTRPTPTRRSWRDLAQTGPNAQKAAEID